MKGKVFQPETPGFNIRRDNRMDRPDEKNETSQMEQLIRINLEDMVSAFGMRGQRLSAWVLRKILYPAARRFAQEIIDFDQEVQEVGLTVASRQFLKTYTHSIQITGFEYLPASGPLLVLSNHPGLTDSIALFANIPRPDLRTLSLDRPFLRAMPETSRRMIFVPEEQEGRTSTLRSVVRHLRHGGAVLTFPAGEIEPDPAFMPGSAEALVRWSQSIAFFIRMCAETQVVPVIVSGVYSAQALHHPLARLRRLPKDRETLAAILQIIAKSLALKGWPIDTRIDFGRPLLAADLLRLTEPRLITQAVIGQAQGLLETLLPIQEGQPTR
jgi:1-acyl-sn-glycerol-3-phosphate acyltransferase